MVNVSKRGLPQQAADRLFKQFAKFIGSLSNANAASVMTDLFSEKEHLVFAKRLAIVLMLDEGCSQRTIARALSVSRTTVIAVDRQYEAGRYDALVAAVRRKTREREELWDTLEVVLRLGMPSRGKDRWKQANRLSGEKTQGAH